MHVRADLAGGACGHKRMCGCRRRSCAWAPRCTAAAGHCQRRLQRSGAVLLARAGGSGVRRRRSALQAAGVASSLRGAFCFATWTDGQAWRRRCAWGRAAWAAAHCCPRAAGGVCARLYCRCGGASARGLPRIWDARRRHGGDYTGGAAGRAHVLGTPFGGGGAAAAGAGRAGCAVATGGRILHPVELRRCHGRARCVGLAGCAVASAAGCRRRGFTRPLWARQCRSWPAVAVDDGRERRVGGRAMRVDGFRGQGCAAAWCKPTRGPGNGGACGR